VNKFYAVDRAGSLVPGMTIDLKRHDDVNPDFLQKHVDSLFSDGFSTHGDRYLLTNSSRGNISSPAIELLFEYIRQAHFPERTSRFQSFFACESIEDAKIFRNQFGAEENRIFEVLATSGHFRANMNLLNNNQTSLICSHLGHEYWRGNTVSAFGEFWEVLLTLPVTIGEPA
jgi:Protein of unknown function (DUF2441)